MRKKIKKKGKYTCRTVSVCIFDDAVDDKSLQLAFKLKRLNY